VASFHMTLRLDQTIFKVLKVGGLDKEKWPMALRGGGVKGGAKVM